MPDTPAAVLRPELLALVRPHLLPAIRVRLRDPAPADPPHQPRHGGDPARPPDAPWPVCGNCDKPLAFLAQFSAMERFWRVFSCPRCNPWSDAHRQQGRVVLEQVALADVPDATQPSPQSSPWRPQAWDLEPVASPPLASDEDALPVPLPAAYTRWLEDQDSQEDLADDETAEVFASWGAWAGVGTQLGGHAHFIQGPPSVPPCPHCARPLELLARLDTEAEVGLMWGDMGAAYLHACPHHPDAVHFEMQCY